MTNSCTADPPAPCAWSADASGNGNGALDHGQEPGQRRDTELISPQGSHWTCMPTHEKPRQAARSEREWAAHRAGPGSLGTLATSMPGFTLLQHRSAKAGQNPQGRWLLRPKRLRVRLTHLRRGPHPPGLLACRPGCCSRTSRSTRRRSLDTFASVDELTPPDR